MKNTFRLHMLLALALSLCLPATIFAQAKNQRRGNDIKQKTIIITKKMDGDEEKTFNLKVDGDDVYLNGKLIDKNDSSLEVHVFPMASDSSFFPLNFSFEPATFNTDFFGNGNKARLGVHAKTENGKTIISKLTEGSPAEKAGLKAGDIILKINNDEVSKENSLTKLIGKYNPGDKVKIAYERDEKKNSVDVTLDSTDNVFSLPAMGLTTDDFYGLGEYNPTGVYKPFGNHFYGRGEPNYSDTFKSFGNPSPKLGISIQDVEEGKGAKIINIKEGSVAKKAGLKVDDIITHINDEEITNVDEVASLMMHSPVGSPVKINMLRNGKKETCTINFPKKVKTITL